LNTLSGLLKDAGEMRHFGMMHGFLGGGLAGFFLMHIIRRAIMGVMMLVLVVGVIYLFAKLQRERARNRAQGWEP
jgi:hypothetical protein